MYEPHESLFDVPDDTIIWKYLDLFKYLDLIANKQLFMLRCDCFADKYEGMAPSYETISRLLHPDEYPQKNKIVLGLLSAYEEQRKSSYVNCWHINNFESSIMWDAYSNKNGGLAIKTTAGHLKHSILDQRKIYLSEVIYGRDKLGIGNLMYPLIVKREEFADERECRIFISPVSTAINQPEEVLAALPKATKISVDIDVLIQEAIFHPLAEDWVCESITNVISHVNANFIPRKSTLYSRSE
ncbi:DUF2971 domain-containing protein [Sphingobacterium chuzhouense]|uniref:DUF2971 domain-containing protein n=1 Tax=Sphingobacterium chuzhouense TaxID=1742264 RepID=A0ABR7XRQ4_9SPHI|nr:DUF2971 domain-containing protein [Sphingobacterium chuzhouense]MBD1421219.1 DUF2971 domain-containing protein [Sphingobacterium chuzhouense]